MQVQVFKGNGVVALEDRPHPVVNAHNNVLVELMSCGICGTDMNILSVPPLHTVHVNTIIGHEGTRRKVSTWNGQDCGRRTELTSSDGRSEQYVQNGSRTQIIECWCI